MLIRVSALLSPLRPHFEDTLPTRLRRSSPLGAIGSNRLAMAEHIEVLKAHRGMMLVRAYSGPHREDLPTPPGVPRQIPLQWNRSTHTAKLLRLD
jgi:hypothetical protein